MNCQATKSRAVNMFLSVRGHGLEMTPRTLPIIFHTPPQVRHGIMFPPWVYLQHRKACGQTAPTIQRSSLRLAGLLRRFFFHFTHMQISQLYDFLKEEASGSCILDASELHLVPFQHSVGLFRGRCIDIFQNLLSNMLADIPIAWS